MDTTIAPSGGTTGSNSDFWIGDALIQPSSGQVIRGESTVRLEPKSMDVLVCLARHAGEVVSKEDLIGTVWPDTFTTDHVLTHAIWQLRRSLGENGGTEYIQTIPKRGYRLLAEVRPTGVGQVTAVAPLRTPWYRSRQAVAGLSVLLIAAIAVLLLARAMRSRPGKDSAQPLRLAILPFTNLSGNSQQEYVSDGLTEEIISQVGRLNPQRLVVIARASVMPYKTDMKPVGQIAKDLRADYVLESSVRQQTKRFRVSTRLIDARSETQIWAEDYDQDVSDILLVQQEIARAVADKVRIRLTPEQRKRLTAPAPVDSQTYDLYLQARYYIGAGNHGDFARAAVLLEKAVAQAPSFAPAWAQLVLAYQGTTFEAQDPEQVLSKLKTAAAHAAALDPESLDVHLALIQVKGYDYDWAGAEQECRHALELAPYDAWVHGGCGTTFLMMRRFDEAVAELRRAVELEPGVFQHRMGLAIVLQNAGRAEDALAERRKLLAMRPDDPGCWLAMVGLLGRLGRFDEAEQALKRARQKIVAAGGSPTDADPWEATLLIRRGQRDKARQMFLRYRAELLKNDPLSVADVHAMLGEDDIALQILEDAFRRHTPTIVEINYGAVYDRLHANPRYQTLLRRMNLLR